MRRHTRRPTPKTFLDTGSMIALLHNRLGQAFGLTLIAASLGGASIVAAGAPRLSDASYIDANRCLGLMGSKALGQHGAGALASFVRAQRAGRPALVEDKALEARQDARLQADIAGDETRAALAQERDGQCQAYLSD
jgi:hypothetical protein